MMNRLMQITSSKFGEFTSQIGMAWAIYTIGQIMDGDMTMMTAHKTFAECAILFLFPESRQWIMVMSPFLPKVLYDLISSENEKQERGVMTPQTDGENHA